MFYAFIIYVYNNVHELVGYRVRFTEKCGLTEALVNCMDQLELSSPILGIVIDEAVGMPNFLITNTTIKL